jgi:hypothetical protein
VAVSKQQEATFLEEMKGHSEADEAFVLSCSYLLELAKRASELFMRSQAEQKNRLLRFVFANASVEGEKLNYKLKSVFSGIVECNKSENWLPSLGIFRTHKHLLCAAEVPHHSAHHIRVNGEGYWKLLQL